MKFTIKFLALIFGLLLASAAHAESPREQIRQMVEQLQKSPSDDALREKIIKLAQTLKPALVIPEEAERRMVRGTAAFKGAKSVADYRDAAKEFEQATLAAPWYGDAYFNLGVAQDKAENYEAALRSLKLALLALSNDKDIKALIYEVEYRGERASSPEALAAKRKQQEQEERQAAEEMIRGLEGATFVDGGASTEWNRAHFLRIRNGKVERVDREVDGRTYLCGGRSGSKWPEPIGTEMVCHQSGAFTGRKAVESVNDEHYEISSDGHELVASLVNKGQVIYVTRYKRQ